MRSLNDTDIDFSKFDFEEIFSVIESTKKMKSKNQWKFLRSHIHEMAISKYSNAQLEYVGDTEVGRDFVSKNGVCYESKEMQNLFQGGYSSQTKQITLRNVRGDGFSMNHYKSEGTFNYMLLWDTDKNSVGICNWDDAWDNAFFQGKEIKTQINLNKIQFVAKYITPKPTKKDIFKQLNKMIMKSI